MRKISQTLAIMGLLAPWGVNALGIGDILLHSALDETLNAEIPLVSSENEDFSDIRVTLASPEAFARSHIERSFLLTKLRFTPSKKPDGSLVINVSSKDAIREPILDFMIEVYWPQGRLLREFAVLLDPPDSFQLANAPNKQLPEREGYKRTEAQTELRSSSLEPKPAQPHLSINAGRGRSTHGVISSEIKVTGTDYGPVERNETLWDIATKFKHPNVNQRQMLDALFKANPQAFYKPSINALKAGVTITIPDQASIDLLVGTAGISHRGQNGEKPSTKAKSPTEPVIAATREEPGKQGQLELLAPSDSKLLTEAATARNRGNTGKSNGELAVELADTAKQEIENLLKRMSDLERQLSAMQKLLALKDGQIATLRSQQTPTPKESQQPVPIDLPSAIQANNSPPQPPTPSALPATTQATAQSPELPQANLAPSRNPSIPPTPPPTPKPVEPTLPKPPPRELGPSAPTQGRPVNSNALAELINQPYLLIGGATTILILALLWQFTRRRSAITEATESILTFTDREKITDQWPPPVPEETNVPQNVTEQPSVFRSSFLSEFTPSDFDALSGEMTEVDPISEADVYLAYGRNKQAEELILGVIKQNPERDDCRLKLLEIHYATENALAFEKYAQELAPTHKEAKPEFWGKVVEMGRELCSSNPLFKDNQPSPADYTIPRAASLTNVQTGPKQDISLFNQDDGLVSVDYPPKPALSEVPKQGPPEDFNPTIAYDFFSTEEKVTGEEQLGKESADEPKQIEIENLISFSKTERDTAEGEIEIPEESMEEMLAKLGALSEQTSAKPSLEEKTPIDRNQNHSGPNYGGMSVDDTQNSLDFEQDIPNNDSSVQFDEVANKLDLAKAYYDLGDEESARTILQNVIQFGNSDQKNEAISLLDRFTSQE